MSKEEVFKIKTITPISDIVDGKIKELSTSDLCIQNDTHIAQFELTEVEKERKRYKIKPGCLNFVPTNVGLILDKFELKQPNLLESVDNTQAILKEANLFFSRLSVYEELGIEKKRSLLLYGEPGTGKSSGITRVCEKFLKEDKGTVVINWNSATVRSSDVLDFLGSGSEFKKECTRLILIIEDIGTDTEYDYGSRSVDRSLLNLLDGIGINFAIPTFILATTNYANKLPKNLADRPGRFDKMIEVGYPSKAERVLLTEFIAKRNLTNEEKNVIMSKDCDSFSIAHLKEIVVRSKLDDKSIGQVVKELKAHAKKFENEFVERNSMGML